MKKILVFAAHPDDEFLGVELIIKISKKDIRLNHAFLAMERVREK